MKTREQVLEAVRGGRGSECLDGRDYSRLVEFFPVEDWKYFGFSLKEGVEVPVLKEWTRERVLAQLRVDVEFGFEKALGQRGLSAGMMYSVVKMWLWVLDHELQHHSDDDYPQYGLPLFKRVAVEFGFDNPIGEDYGDEGEYEMSYTM